MSEKPFQTFLCEYGYEGSRWGFDVKATSWEDARARVKAMGAGKVVGTNVTRIPVPGWWPFSLIAHWLASRFPPR